MTMGRHHINLTPHENPASTTTCSNTAQNRPGKTDTYSVPGAACVTKWVFLEALPHRHSQLPSANATSPVHTTISATA